MSNEGKIRISVTCTVNSTLMKVWEYWTIPQHIIGWNFASDDWHCPNALNDFRIGGKFTSRMEAKDGSFGFDFWGIYDEIIYQNKITYTMGDGRRAEIYFEASSNNVTITETFEAETENTVELQREGWQAILNNFKKYVEAN